MFVSLLSSDILLRVLIRLQVKHFSLLSILMNSFVFRVLLICKSFTVNEESLGFDKKKQLDDVNSQEQFVDI